MAGKGQTLRSEIIVSGRADSSLGTLAKRLDSWGNQLAKMGAGITAFTAPLVAAGKQAVELYTDYDDVMKYIQAIGDYSTEEMKDISAAARQAGVDTRYMASDAGMALQYMTQAGIQKDSAIAMLPELLNGAAAGGMDLATTADLLIGNMYSLSKPFTDTEEYLDQVATAAAATNSDMQELMEGVSRLGATGQLVKGGTAELLTYFGLLANINQKGTEAGTHMRNIILSLVAPTSRAEDAMAALGASEEEISDALDGVDLEASREAIGALGLEVFDAAGNMRPMADILKEMKEALDELSDSEQTRILQDIFSRRTVPVATGLINQMDDTFDSVFDGITNSAGTVQRMADTMEGGIGGATRRLSSAMEEVQLSWAEAGESRATDFINTLRDAALWLAALDEPTKQRWIDLVTGIATAGGGLLVFGGGIKALGKILSLATSPVGWLTIATTAMSAYVVQLRNAHEESKKNTLEKSFGALTINSEDLRSHLEGLTGEFLSGVSALNSYDAAIQQATENYQTSMGQLGAGVLDAFLSQTELSDTDKKNLQTLAGNMLEEIENAFNAEAGKKQVFIELAYEGDEENLNYYSSIMDIASEGALSEAKALGADLMSTLTAAMEDQIISGAENEKIKATMKALSDLMAEAQRQQEKDALRASLYGLTDLSYESFESAMEEFEIYRNEMLAVGMGEYYKQAVDMENLFRAGSLPNRSGEIVTDPKEARALIDDMLQEGQDTVELDMMDSTGFLTRIAQNGLGNFEQITPWLDIFDAQRRGEEINPHDVEYSFEKYGTLRNYGQTQAFLASLEKVQQAFSMEDLTGSMDALMRAGKDIPEEMLQLYDIYRAGELMGLGILDEINFDGTRDRITDDLINEGRTDFNGFGSLKQGQGYFDYAAAYSPTITEPEPSPTAAGEQYISDMDQYLEANPAAPQVDMPSGAEAAGSFTREGQNYLNSHPMTAFINILSSGLGITTGAAVAGEGLGLFAEGGRSDKLAFFGDAGPEWVIPEERTENTARLLSEAAHASGFSLSELASQEADERSGASGHTFVFSPQVSVKVEGSGGGLTEADIQRAVQKALEQAKEQFMDIVDEQRREEERLKY